MTTPQLDRNLLVGILALQMDFIDRDQLIAAMQAWLLNKQARLEDLLLASHALRQDTYEFLVAMVAKHLEVHGGDPDKSLAAVSSLASLQHELRSLQDDEVDATLNRASAVLPTRAKNRSNPSRATVRPQPSRGR